MNAASRQTLRRIVIDVEMGKDRMAASDDPVFLGLRGPEGREFRLAYAKGRQWRRGAQERFVLAAPGASDVNIARPELNDPTVPEIDVARIRGVYLRKDQDPIPNVRGHGEMDDRLELAAVAVELHADGLEAPLRFSRQGPIWLGLVCGTLLEIAGADAGE